MGPFKQPHLNLSWNSWSEEECGCCPPTLCLSKDTPRVCQCWGGREPGACPRPPLHMHTYSHSCAQTHFPSLSFSLSLSSQSHSPSLHCSSLPISPSQVLSVWISLNLCPPLLSSLSSPSLPSPDSDTFLQGCISSQPSLSTQPLTCCVHIYTQMLSLCLTFTVLFYICLDK